MIHMNINAMDFMTSYLYRSYSSVEGEFLLEKRRSPESPTKVFLIKHAVIFQKRP